MSGSTPHDTGSGTTPDQSGPGTTPDADGQATTSDGDERATTPAATGEGRPRVGTNGRDPSDAVAVRSDLPVHRCARCGRPFAEESLLALHRGLAHPAALDEEEVAAFRDAHGAEEAEIRRFRLRALAGLVVLYFLLLMVYALV